MTNNLTNKWNPTNANNKYTDSQIIANFKQPNLKLKTNGRKIPFMIFMFETT